MCVDRKVKDVLPNKSKDFTIGAPSGTQRHLFRSSPGRPTVSNPRNSGGETESVTTLHPQVPKISRRELNHGRLRCRYLYVNQKQTRVFPRTGNGQKLTVRVENIDEWIPGEVPRVAEQGRGRKSKRENTERSVL